MATDWAVSRTWRNDGHAHRQPMRLRPLCPAAVVAWYRYVTYTHRRRRHEVDFRLSKLCVEAVIIRPAGITVCLWDDEVDSAAMMMRRQYISLSDWRVRCHRHLLPRQRPQQQQSRRSCRGRCRRLTALTGLPVGHSWLRRTSINHNARSTSFWIARCSRSSNSLPTFHNATAVQTVCLNRHWKLF